MAVKLAAQYEGKLLYVNGVGWHRWDGKRCARDADGAARRAVHAMLKRDRQIVHEPQPAQRGGKKRLRQIARYETASAITGILTEAAALQAFSVAADELDADPWLFNCANGTLDLRTMELRPHDPADRITKIADAAYDPTPAARQWAAFLAKVLPDNEVRDYLRRLTGLSLLGEVNGDKQIAPIAYGGGANGKTTFIETVCFALGDYAMTAEPDAADEQARRSPSDRRRRPARQAAGHRTTETQQGARFDIALLKRLTGGDTLKARWMRQDFFEFAPSHLLLMCTNHLPEIDDGSEAVWRRIRLIPFTVEIPKAERDEGLKDKLRAEADAVLTLGHRRLGRLPHARARPSPRRSWRPPSDYQADSDAVGRFIADECLTGGAQSSATTSELLRAWETWAAKDGCLPMSLIAFGRELDVKGYPVDPNAHRRPRRGICLKPAGFFKVAGP